MPLKWLHLVCQHLLKKIWKPKAAKQGNWFQRAIHAFGDVFVLIIPVIVGWSLHGSSWPHERSWNDTSRWCSTIYSQILTDAAFIILPGLLYGQPSAYSVEIVLGMMLVSGSPNAWAMASGGEVTAMNSLASFLLLVLPKVLFFSLHRKFRFGPEFEKSLLKWFPVSLDLLVTPFVTLWLYPWIFVTSGPVFHVVENYILGTKAILGTTSGGSWWLGSPIDCRIECTHVAEVQLLLLAMPTHSTYHPAAMTAQGAATVAVGVKLKILNWKHLLSSCSSCLQVQGLPSSGGKLALP